MGLRIRTNVQSLIAQRHLSNSTDKVARQQDKLSSGYRINRAADDAAGLAISEALRADVRSLSQAKRNALDAISLVQVAEGGLEEVNNMMVRLRELSIQAASDTVGIREREYLNNEFMALKDEIDRIALTTDFNGTKLLVGKSELHPSLTGAHNNSPLEIHVGKDYFPMVDSLESHNPVNIIRIDFDQFNARTHGQGSLNIGATTDKNGTTVISKEAAKKSIERLDSAMTNVAAYRAKLGAYQNRLETTQSTLGISIENLDSARSRIRDADFASESASLTQWQIMQQAGASVLAQANQAPQIALKLLG
jgi:flagellin